MFHNSVISLSMVLSIAFFDINIAQTTCGADCPCRCNADPSRPTLIDCSNRQFTTVPECGSLGDFQEVNLTQNDITELVTLLTGCSNDLSYNRINTVRVSWQPRPYSCNDYLLDLSHNAMRRLSREGIAIQYFPLLIGRIVINLSFNKMKYLERTSIVISDLPGRCIKRITLNLSFNKLLSVHPNAFLARASIHEIHLLWNNNKLNNFTVSSFVDDDKLDSEYYVINLRDNNISGFHEEDIENVLHDDVNLILDGNPWNCDCSQRYVSFNTSRLRRFLNNNNSVEAICEAPYFTKGRQMLSLSKDEFICEPKLDQNANLSVNISAGDTLRLLCPAIGADPPVTSVDWQIPSGSLANGPQVSFIYVRTCFNCYLVINNIEKSLEGVYQCTVSNGQNLTIMQRVMVDDVIRAGVYTTTSASYTTSCDSTKAVKRPLLLLLIILLILVVAIVSLIVVRYKSHKPTDKEIPLPPKSKSETAHNAPGSDRYCDHVAEKESIEDNEHYYLKPDVFKTHRNEEDEVPYVNININHIYVNSR
ncbi:uncharacterized protein [Apostichopus japonicus]|uniref:uncharacterized protein n=1 Tax=Stichopus japonicus TaxID=307972 RepID=UPI003AB254FD